MPRHKATGSKISLLALCAFPFKEGTVWPWTEMGQPAIDGTALHAANDTTLRTKSIEFVRPSESRLAKLDETTVRALHAAWVREWYTPRANEPWQPEDAFAVDPFAGRVMRLTGGPRDYRSVPDSFVPVTADAVKVDDDCVHVVDWKTGRAAHVEPAAENAQLLTGALAASLYFKRPNARVSIVYVAPEGVRVDEAEVDALTLHDWREELARLIASIPTAEATPGSWCRSKWCPLNGTCPATSGALVQISDKPRLPVVTDAAKIQGPEHAAFLYQFLRQVKAREALVWDALRRWADANGGVPTEPGKVWVKRETTREAIDLSQPAAVDALRSALGPHADAALELSTTKKAIEAAARLVANETGEPIAVVKRRTLAALHEVGAVTRKNSETYEETEIEDEKRSA